MWVYDGDEWINEGANVPVKSENENLPRDEFYPEMQVIEVEIVPPPPRVEYLPMLPLH